MTEGVDFVVEYELRCTLCGHTVKEWENYLECICAQWIINGPDKESAMPTYWKYIEYRVAIGGDESDIPFE